MNFTDKLTNLDKNETTNLLQRTRDILVSDLWIWTIL
jgi:hypothetical protein